MKEAERDADLNARERLRRSSRSCSPTLCDGQQHQPAATPTQPSSSSAVAASSVPRRLLSADDKETEAAASDGVVVERTRRYESGGSSSSSGLSLDAQTGGVGGGAPASATLNGGVTSAAAASSSSDVFVRIRDLSEERGGITSSGDEEVRIAFCSRYKRALNGEGGPWTPCVAHHVSKELGSFVNPASRTLNVELNKGHLVFHPFFWG